MNMVLFFKLMFFLAAAESPSVPIEAREYHEDLLEDETG